MADRGDRYDQEMLRLRNNVHRLAGIVTKHGYRIERLEEWRHADEPRLAELYSNAEIARAIATDEIQKARHHWTIIQTTAAAAAGAVVVAGGVVSILQAVHVL